MKLPIPFLVLGALTSFGAYFALEYSKDISVEYKRLMDGIALLDVDGFTRENASFARQAQVVLTERVTGASKFPLGTQEAVALEWRASDAVEGLRVTQAATGSANSMAKIDPKKSLVVGTIRMGFGHHRIAYAMSSWGLQQPGLDVYFHDLLSIDSQEAGLIRETDAMYRASSKLATEYGGPFEWFHGMLTSSGDATSMRSTALIGARLAPLMKGLPPDVPVIASHSLVALAAAVAGSKTILNLVIDNHPQWFVITPKAHNLVQGPRNYIGLSKMLGGVKDATTLTLAGHWIPQDLVVNAEADAAWRSSRASTPSAPLTILIPVGGAGAQRTFITSLIKELAPLVEAGRVRLVVNAGDHADMKEALLESLSAIAGEVNVISNIAEARGLAKNLRAWAPGNEDAMPLLNLMAFTDYFAAVAATDILTRAVDVLACKPSELAFYPVPKLMIRRVGDHEAHSASRANELGDGTAEARTVADALEYTKLFLASEPLQTMNAAISVNARAGVYDGCKNALGHAQIA